MNEYDNGLMERTIIRQIAEQWKQGGAGVVLLQLSDGSPIIRAAARQWAGGDARLFRRIRLANDEWFFLRFGESAERTDELAARAAQSLRETIGAAAAWSGGERAFSVGFSSASPPRTGHSAESAVYRAMKEAVVSAASDGAAGQGRAPGSGSEAGGKPAFGEWGRLHAIGEIGALAKPIPTFESTEPVSAVARYFEANPQIQGAVIVQSGEPLGIVMKEKVHQLLAGQYGQPLYWNRSVQKIMDRDALVVDAALPVDQASQLAMAREISRLYDFVVVTRDGKLLGAASIRSILECITSLRTEEARTANPLTGLPGNAVIQRELQRRIEAGMPFAIIYADLDYFKWFNDCFGFSRGDELIRFLAATLRESLRNGGDGRTFVGHIGGDDFIAFTDSARPEELCRSIVERFDVGVTSFYEEAEPAAVTDRSGARVEQSGVSVSLSLLVWDGREPITPDEVSKAAARLKKEAKARTGSVIAAGILMNKQFGEGRLQT